jgi:hypothetical protein
LKVVPLLAQLRCYSGSNVQLRDYLAAPRAGKDAELHITKVVTLIDCNQFVTKPSGQQPPYAIVLTGFYELVHQARRRCEADAPSLPTGGNTQRGSQVSLTCAAIAGQHHRFRSIDIAPLGQVADLGRRDRGRLGKLKILQGS